MFIGLGFILAIIMGLLGRYVAIEKNRSQSEGFWLGFLFSILGVIIVALLPTKEKQTIKPKEESISDEEIERIKEMRKGEDKVFGDVMLWFLITIVVVGILVFTVYL